MKLPKKRLLILSVRVGSGHIRAAEALEKVAKENFGLEVNHVNFLEYIDPKLAIFFEKMWYLLVKYAPFLEKVTYEAGRTKPNIWFKNLGRYLKVDFKKYKQLVREYKPDIIVSTHYLPAAIISWMSDRLSIPNGVVITDHIPHSMWFYPGNDVIFAADQWVLDDLKKMGVKKDKICLSGIPVGKEFLKNFDIDRLKNKFNLKTKKTTLLLMGGGDAVGPFLKILKSLAKEKMGNKFQLIVIAGNNKKRQDEIKKIIKNLKIDAKVVGFVKNIEEYMAVSDLLISKPGGLTTTEAITIGLPMLIVNPTPGQEDGNRRFLVDGKAGIYVKDVEDVGVVVKKLLKNPQKIEKMKENAKKISRPQAADLIIKEMLRIAK